MKGLRRNTSGKQLMVLLASWLKLKISPGRANMRQFSGGINDPIIRVVHTFQRAKQYKTFHSEHLHTSGGVFAFTPSLEMRNVGLEERGVCGDHLQADLASDSILGITFGLRHPTLFCSHLSWILPPISYD